MLPKISVIIAVYNCEKYIEVCVRSLFNQTLSDIEYIFVNDATPDNSVTIINMIMNEFPERKPNIKFIHLKENGGVSNARQIGICNATGEYIIHADSDDWIDKEMYERLYNKAKETNADIVGCNFKHEYTNYQYEFQQQYAENKEENIRRLITGLIFPSLCTSLSRRSLIEDYGISFPIGLNMGEDLFFNLQLYLHSQKIVSIDWAPYHYRHTEDSSCVQRTRKSIYSDIAIAGKIEEIMREQNLYNKYSHDIEYRKFYSKLPLVQNLCNKKNCCEWLNIYPETNKKIWQYKQLNWKHRLELWLAANRMLYAARTFKRILEWQYKLKRI